MYQIILNTYIIHIYDYKSSKLKHTFICYKWFVLGTPKKISLFSYFIYNAFIKNFFLYLILIIASLNEKQKYNNNYNLLLHFK